MSEKEIVMNMCILAMIKGQGTKKRAKRKKESKYDVIRVRWGGSFPFFLIFCCCC